MPETYFESSAHERATRGPFTLEVEGLDELQKALEEFHDKWDEMALEALGPGMATLETDAKIFAPVDTGRLQSSIGSQVIKGSGSEIIGKVGSAVEYASYQEFGTRYQSGKPYLRPSLEKNRDKVVKQFEQGIKKVLKRLKLSD